MVAEWLPGSHLLPDSAIRFAVQHHWDNEAILRQLAMARSPLLRDLTIVHGARDSVVPPRQGKGLFELAKEQWNCSVEGSSLDHWAMESQEVYCTDSQMNLKWTYNAAANHNDILYRVVTKVKDTILLIRNDTIALAH